MDIPLEKAVTLRTLLDELDRLEAYYERIPSRDPGLRAIDDLQKRINKFARQLVSFCEQ